jgi:hypothetical protein
VDLRELLNLARVQVLEVVVEGRDFRFDLVPFVDDDNLSESTRVGQKGNDKSINIQSKSKQQKQIQLREFITQ